MMNPISVEVHCGQQGNQEGRAGLKRKNLPNLHQVNNWMVPKAGFTKILIKT
jgi:hypothetical protein